MSESGRLAASVIVPAWNGREYLGPCLDAVLRQQGVAFEVIVVDNASADGSADFVEQEFPQVRLVRNESNRGFAGGCNTGIRAASGEVLVLLNQDTQVQTGWLEALAEALQRPGVGIAGSKILYPDGVAVQHAGAWIEWPLGLTHHYGYGEADSSEWSTRRTAEYVTGAATAIRRQVVDQVGLLDEGFWPGYFEDADYCLRAREAGYEVWYVPEAIVLHAESTSLTSESARSWAYQRGRMRFVLKHLPPERLLAEFVPTERSVLPAAIRGHEAAALRNAYLGAIISAVNVLRDRWHADELSVERTQNAFRELYLLAWDEDWRSVEESAAAAALPLSVTPLIASDLHVGQPEMAALSQLYEYQFRSSVPVLGPVIAWLRWRWYSVAARWVFRHQETINKQHRTYLEALERRVSQLAHENGLLAQEIAKLVAQSDSEV